MPVNNRRGNENESVHPPSADTATQQALDHGENEKVDQVLHELDATTRSGKDQSTKADTEGSNSSCMNLNAQDE
ncbi:hypothetical protein [Paraburkholderia strydomiana]